jgi:hypothetical protein
LRVMAAKMTASRENRAQLRDRRRDKIDGVPGVSLKSLTPSGQEGDDVKFKYNKYNIAQPGQER